MAVASPGEGRQERWVREPAGVRRHECGGDRRRDLRLETAGVAAQLHTQHIVCGERTRDLIHAALEPKIDAVPGLLRAAICLLSKPLIASSGE